ITIKSGRDVPIPNTAGRTTPYEVINTIGIKVNRNNTNIVGQNANVKLTPTKKLPKYLFLKTFVGKLKIRHVLFHANNPIINNPMMISNGPINFLILGMSCGSERYTPFPTSQVTVPDAE